ncbi:hypothetical protein ACKVMT_01485 [Halobacteriales archaeon Cl-PHB]
MGELRSDQANVRDGELTVSDAFRILESRRRRYVLHTLLDHSGSMAVDQLVATIRDVERKQGEDPADHTERIEIALRHTHLPQLEDAGVVTWHRRADAVEREAAMTVLAPFLDLVAAYDLD